MWLLGYICKCNESNLSLNEMNKGWPLHPIFMRRTHIMSFEKIYIFHVKSKKYVNHLENFLNAYGRHPISMIHCVIYVCLSS
jgi:hypothetical protein